MFVNSNGSTNGCIGSGPYGVGGSIIINGGNISNDNNSGGAGVGGGFDGKVDLIEINGGSVNVYANYGAGIGTGGASGAAVKAGGNIKIYGGTVKATSKTGAGIGAGTTGGKINSPGTIEIHGGKVIAKTTSSSQASAAIGGAENNNGVGYTGGIIIIDGGDVTAISEGGHGIGAGGNSKAGSVKLDWRSDEEGTDGYTKIKASSYNTANLTLADSSRLFMDKNDKTRTSLSADQIKELKGKTIIPFRQKGETADVELEFGEGHEDLAAAVASKINEEGECTCTADGSVLSVQWIKSDKADAAVKYLSSFIRAELEDSDLIHNGESYYYVPGIGLKQLSEYSSIEEITELKETLQNTDIEDGLTMYILWQKPLKEAFFKVDAPVCGQEVSVTSGVQHNAPTINSLSEDVAVYGYIAPLWVEEDGTTPYEGTIEGGNEYTAKFYMESDLAHFVDPDNPPRVYVNGEPATVKAESYGKRIPVTATVTTDDEDEDTEVYDGMCIGSRDTEAGLFRATVLTDIHTIRDQGEAACKAIVESGKMGYETVLITGDIVGYGEQLSYDEYIWYMSRCSKDVDIIESIGNHEYQAYSGGREKALKLWREKMGTGVYFSQWVGNTHIIAMGPDEVITTEGEENITVSAEQLEWLRTKVEEDDAEGVTDIIMWHFPTYTGDNALTNQKDFGHEFHDGGFHELFYELVNAHDNVIVFSGHTHRGFQASGALRMHRTPNGGMFVHAGCITDNNNYYTLMDEVEAEDGRRAYTISYKKIGDKTVYGTQIFSHDCPKEEGGDFGYRASVEADVESDHDWGVWTYDDETNHKHVCKNDASHAETEAHTWNDGEVTKEPTVYEEGVRTYTCTICGGTKTEAISKLVAPDAPVIDTDKTTPTTIELKDPVEGQEYIIVTEDTEELDWSDAKTIADDGSLVFEGLTPNTAYKVYTRKASAPGAVSAPGVESTPRDKFTVTFDPHGECESEKTVAWGETVSEPETPSRKGYDFGGWYADSGLTEEYDFTSAVKADVSIYAKWTAFSYGIASGDKQTWTKGSDESLVITAKRSVSDDLSFGRFSSLSIDGKVISKDTDYVAEQGSVIAKIAPAYLEGLSAGDHMALFTFDDGTATAEFTVAAKANDDSEQSEDTAGGGSETGTDRNTEASTESSHTDSVNTGDSSTIMLWLVIMLCAALALTCFAVREARDGLREKREDSNLMI